MKIPGLFVCECGNSTPIAETVKGHTGMSGPVYVFPADVVCGCGRQMQRWYEEEKKDGELPSVHGRDHLGGAPGRGEDPAGRTRAEGLGERPLPDSGVHRPAADREGEPGDAEAGDGGSPSHLPPAARHLAVGHFYRLHGGDYVDQVGELKDVRVTGFGHAYGTLDVWAPEGIVPDVVLNADALTEVGTPHG